MTMGSVMIGQIQGMLLGLHVGDSLGANLEFTQPRKDNLQIDIVGGGGLDWRPGEPTDDTIMMYQLLESIAIRGHFDQEYTAQMFLEWYKTSPKDIGGTVRQALKNILYGMPVEKSGLSTEYSQGNGSLMRSAPLALLDYDDEIIRKQCSITHAHPTCIHCDQIYVYLLELLLEGASKKEAFELALKKAKNINSELSSALLNIDNLNISDIFTEGYVVDSLVFSIWAFMKLDSFEEALITIVNRGGDADTLGAITGAICGAYYGIESIPRRWLDKIELKDDINCTIEAFLDF